MVHNVYGDESTTVLREDGMFMKKVVQNAPAIRMKRVKSSSKNTLLSTVFSQEALRPDEKFRTRNLTE